MRASILRPHEATNQRVDVCVVIDVLRATSTAAVLCHRFDALRVASTPEVLPSLPPAPNGYALFSELAGVDFDCMRFDNSPSRARAADLGGRSALLMTTNGTLAVATAARIADEVVLGSFVNLGAIAAYVRARGVDSVALMPAGSVKRAEAHAEDDACAESLGAVLTASPVDVAAVIARSRHDPRILARLAKETDLLDDVELCFDLDAVPVVPRVVGGVDRGWFEVMRERARSE